MILLLHALAHSSCPSVFEELQSSQNALLEGALDDAQVRLSLVQNSAHCHLFTSEEFHHYLYLRGIYHYLRQENTLAETFFKRTRHAGEDDFGTRIQAFYEKFPTTEALPLRIRHSRFQTLYLGGSPSIAPHFAPSGMQLVQLQDKDRIYFSKWLDTTNTNQPIYHLPRKVSNNWIYAASGSAAISLISIWQAMEQNRRMTDAISQTELEQARKHQSIWSGTAIGFGVVTTTLIGIYLYW